MKTIKGVLIDSANNVYGIREVEDSLESFYSLLDCQLIEVAERRIGVRNHHHYTIVCDEEGTFVDDPYISAIDDLGRAMLVGAIFVCNTDYETGEFSSLTDKQINNVMSKVQMMSTRNHRTPYCMLTQCEY